MNNRYSYKNARSNFRYINSFHLYLSQRRFILKFTKNSITMCAPLLFRPLPPMLLYGWERFRLRIRIERVYTKVCTLFAYIRDYLILIEIIGNKKKPLSWNKGFYSLSERRGSNSRHPPWQGGALPAELLSHL